MHHLRFTPVRPPLRHRCTTAPPSRPITIPPRAIVLAGIVDSTHLSRSRERARPAGSLSKYLRFVRRPSRLHLIPRAPFPSSPPISSSYLRAVLYSRMKRSGRLCSLIASRVTLGENLDLRRFSLSPLDRTGDSAVTIIFPSNVSRLRRDGKSCRIKSREKLLSPIK